VLLSQGFSCAFECFLSQGTGSIEVIERCQVGGEVDGDIE
jgi:hypothetical protein